LDRFNTNMYTTVLLKEGQQEFPEPHRLLLPRRLHHSLCRNPEFFIQNFGWG
jgi:hypothetical protein